MRNTTNSPAYSDLLSIILAIVEEGAASLKLSESLIPSQSMFTRLAEVDRAATHILRVFENGGGR